MSGFDAVEASYVRLVDATFEEHEWNDSAWRERVDACCAVLELAWNAYLRSQPDAEEVARARSVLANALVRRADDLFYDHGESNAALLLFALVIHVEPESVEGYKGSVVCHLQGSDRNPRAALPFAVKHAELDQSRAADVAYIRSLIAK
jgi:hypothetical protein